MSGGYDFVLVGNAIKEFECPICLFLIKEAVQLPCTHAFCSSCVDKWQNEVGKR